MGGTIRVLVADDHAMVRRGIATLLAAEPDIEVVAEAANGLEVLAKVARFRPDVVLLDLVMPAMDGLDTIRSLARERPGTRVLVLTGFEGDEKVFPAIRAGADGYLLKQSGPEEVVRAIRQVYRGQCPLHPTIARKVLSEISSPNSVPAEHLTRREIDVLRLLTEGHSNQEIAARLVLSEATVSGYVSSILDKLNLTSRTQAALYALRAGLVVLETPAASQ